MASSQPKIDSFSPENQHENQPPQNTNTDSVTVKVENPDSVTEPQTEPSDVQNKNSSFQTGCMRIPKPLRHLIRLLLFVCLAPVAYACVTVVTFTLMPLILGAFVVVRLLQFIIKCEVFEKYFNLKLLMRYWILVVMILLLIEIGLFYPIAKYVPGVKSQTIIGLTITKWIKIICILIGIYLINLVSWVLTSFILACLFTDRNDGSWELVLEGVSEIFGCLLFLWAEVVVMNSVPTFKQSKIFGVYTRKWIKISLFVLIGYNIITLLTHIFVWSLTKVFRDDLRIGEKLSTALSVACCDTLGNGVFKKKYVVYVCNGIKRSIIFILSAVMLLLTWILYFDDHLDKTPHDKRILEFGTWSLVSVLICSFFWLIKSCIILYWGAHAVNNRIHSKVTDIGKQLYFLVLLSYINFKFLESKVRDSDDKPSSGKVLWVILDTKSEGDEGDEYQTFERKIVREKLISHTTPKASIHDIQQATQLILNAQYSLSKESIFTNLNHLQNGNSGHNDENITEILKTIVLGEKYSEEDWNMLLKLLHGVHTREVITFQEVKTWMERAHSRCRFLANTLISEKEVAKCLDQVIIGIILGVTFIMWLLLTNLATTQVLVLIASPLLAATFIFGDTCKSLFQGLIFVYIVHPFDVGDLCVVDEKLLEVKKISVWSTTFSKVRTTGKQQEVIYPNSDLAAKNVINHKTEFDWNDYIEFSLSNPDEETTKNLKRQIENYLDAEKKIFTPNFHSVEFLEIGDKAKIGVHIKHNVQTEGWTYFECLKEKEKRRFDFAVYIQNLVNQQDPQTQTSELQVDMDQQVTRDD